MTSSGPWRPPARDDRARPDGALPDGALPGGARGDGPGADGVGETGAEGDPSAPPEEIRTAWVLWLAATTFALVGMLLNSATARFGDLPPATRDAFRQAVDTAGTVDMSVESLFSIALAVGSVLALVAAAVTVWLAFRLRAGKGWARTLLDIAAIFLVVDAVSVIIGVFGGVAGTGERDDVLSFIIFSLQILAGLCAATAVWRQHTAEAMEYTTKDRARRAGK